MMREGPHTAPQAHDILRRHSDDGGDCGQCRGRYCWMLQWAVTTTISTQQPIPQDVWPSLTLAARRVATWHWPGNDGRCSPCLKANCDALTKALIWLNVVDREWMPHSERTAADVLSAAATPTVEELRRITGMG